MVLQRGGFFLSADSIRRGGSQFRERPVSFPFEIRFIVPSLPRVYTYFMLGGTSRLGRRAACLLDKRNSCKIPLLWPKSPYVI